MSDGEGAFELSAPEGHWTLRVEYPGLRSWREDSVPAGSRRHVVLDRARVLALLVVDERDAPVPDAQLLLVDDPYCNPGSAREAARSDAAGRAEMELQPGGSWFVHASHPSFRSALVALPPSDAAS